MSSDVSIRGGWGAIGIELILADDPQSLHRASYFSGVQDDHVSRSSYGTNWGVLAKISTRKSINTVVLAARRRPPALSANMDFRLSYSGNRRRTAPDAISSANSHAGPLAMPRWLSTAARICSASLVRRLPSGW